MYSHYYFLGIAGMGMSALARYFHARGFTVAGYDRSDSVVSRQLLSEGIRVSHSDNPDDLPADFPGSDRTLVVRTPAISEAHPLYRHFCEHGYKICKRAEVLGLVTQELQALCIAGTHGKTTTSTMLAHLLHSSVGCNAFLGGISNNYHSNLLLSAGSPLVVVEADEYDRSFLHLRPHMAVITSVDADHLDIYGDLRGYRQGFCQFASLIEQGGVLLTHKRVDLQPKLQEGVRHFTYSGSAPADFYADRLRLSDGTITFDFHAPDAVIEDITLGVPALINVENSVAAIAIAHLCGASAEQIKAAMPTYSGIYRRFNRLVDNDRYVLIDDYAHHPAEISASLRSVRALYQDRPVVGVFQPHLYTRTRDFADQFAAELSKFDEVVLLPIYPAREAPISGVSSEMLLDKITCPRKSVCTRQELPERLKQYRGYVILTLGAGDIDQSVPLIAAKLQ